MENGSSLNCSSLDCILVLAEFRARRAPQLRKFGKPMNAKNFGLVMTSLLLAPLSVRTQSHNANAPVFVWREVAWRDAFTTEMLKNTKYKVNLYVFVGYVDKRGKERKREKKKTEKRGRLSKIQRERERQIAI